jgi:transcriptional regulator with XRE-family HTH domain
VRLPRLREWREARGLIQNDLARAAGVSKFTVVRIEHGANTHPDTARKLAKALEIDVTDLMESPPVPKVPAPSKSGQPEKTTEEPVLAIDIGEFRAKLRGEGVDEDTVNLVVGVAENAVVGGESLYGDVAPTSTGQPEAQKTARVIRLEATDSAGATDKAIPLIDIGEFKELLVEAGLDQESAEWTAERVFAMVEARRDR